jgi:PAP2 superfamily
MKTRRLLVGIAAGLLAACHAERPTGVDDGVAVANGIGAGNAAIKFWDVGSTVAWNTHASNLMALRPADAVRVLTYVSMAQYRAAEAAKASTAEHPPVSAAIAGASAQVLRLFFPLDVAQINTWLAQQEAAASWPGAKHDDWAAGEALGRSIGSLVAAWSLTDNVGQTDPGAPPAGAGKWSPGAGPTARGGLGARPLFIASAAQVMPPPPPVFGSDAYLAALQEVRQISDTRTLEQLQIAQYWARAQSPVSAEGMNSIARRFIQQYRRQDDEAARIMFLMNGAAWDAIIGCFHAKYTYWFIRPPQADPGITLPIGLPPHPSYPSAHSCISGASTGIMAAIFPSQATYLEGVATEASLSRLYAGIHYRFDMVAGLALGRAVASVALATDLGGVGPSP